MDKKIVIGAAAGGVILLTALIVGILWRSGSDGGKDPEAGNGLQTRNQVENSVKEDNEEDGVTDGAIQAAVQNIVREPVKTISGTAVEASIKWKDMQEQQEQQVAAAAKAEEAARKKAEEEAAKAQAMKEAEEAAKRAAQSTAQAEAPAQESGNNSGEASSVAPPSQPAQPTKTSPYADEIIRLVNVERANAGLPSLSKNGGACQAADRRASEIVSSFSHTRPDGREFSTVFDEFGISYTAWGENIAAGQPTPEAVVNAWMNSPGHRANILNENFAEIGIGTTEVNGEIYWVQLFLRTGW